jgi:hypothetical protein
MKIMKIKSVIGVVILTTTMYTATAQSWLAGTGTLNVTPVTTKVGIGSTAPGARLTLGSGNVTTTPTILEGITWQDATPLNYGIYRTAGAWTSPNFQQLQINWLTGIVLNPGPTSATGKNYVDVQGGGLRVSSGNVYIGDYDAWSSPLLKMSISFSGTATADAKPALIVSKRIIGTPDVYRRILFVPHLYTGAYSYMTVDGDMGIIGHAQTGTAGFVVGPSGASWIGIRITPTGNVGISTNLVTNPDNFKLGVCASNTGAGSGIWVQTAAGAAYGIKTDVNDVLTKAFVISNAGVENFKVLGSGNVYARSITVQLTAFPDYVFKEEYKLKTLYEVESYIKTNGHLPEIPSAKTVEECGVNLGELVKLQMQKIEELTLYLIDLKKENSDLNTRIEKIEKSNK